jgi:diguanylate cyclase (GGDEF)-like protein
MALLNRGLAERAWPSRLRIQLLLGSITLSVAAVTVAGQDVTSPYPIFYFLVVASAACFLRWVEVVIQGGFVAIAYATSLALIPGGTHGDRWEVWAVALAVGIGFIGVLRHKQNQLVQHFGEITRIDALTGLLNARGVEETLVREIERARRSDCPFGLMVAAVDGFLGHQVRFGDAEARAVIVQAGRAISEGKRAIDAAGRLEEDHFALLSTYTDERGAAELAQRVRDIANDGLEARGKLAMSLGIASYPRHGKTPEELLDAARGALAEARELGGNRTLVARAPEHSIEERMQGAPAEVLPTS